MVVFAYATRYFASSIGSIENGLVKLIQVLMMLVKYLEKSEIKNIIKVYLPLMKPYIISGF